MAVCGDRLSVGELSRYMMCKEILAHAYQSLLKKSWGTHPR